MLTLNKSILFFLSATSLAANAAGSSLQCSSSIFKSQPSISAAKMAMIEAEIDGFEMPEAGDVSSVEADPANAVMADRAATHAELRARLQEMILEGTLITVDGFRIPAPDFRNPTSVAKWIGQFWRPRNHVSTAPTDVSMIVNDFLKKSATDGLRVSENWSAGQTAKIKFLNPKNASERETNITQIKEAYKVSAEKAQQLMDTMNAIIKNPDSAQAAYDQLLAGIEEPRAEYAQYWENYLARTDRTASFREWRTVKWLLPWVGLSGWIAAHGGFTPIGLVEASGVMFLPVAYNVIKGTLSNFMLYGRMGPFSRAVTGSIKGEAITDSISAETDQFLTAIDAVKPVPSAKFGRPSSNEATGFIVKAEDLFETIKLNQTPWGEDLAQFMRTGRKNLTPAYKAKILQTLRERRRVMTRLATEINNTDDPSQAFYLPKYDQNDSDYQLRQAKIDILKVLRTNIYMIDAYAAALSRGTPMWLNILLARHTNFLLNSWNVYGIQQDGPLRP